MRPFRVWAPGAETVALERDGRREEMRADGEWWWHEDPTITSDVRYGFVVDGKGPFPDPRSPSQPDGVHGLSATVEHDRFPWTDDAWRGLPLAGAIIYEAHIGTMTPEGTFDAAIDRLPHLVELGIDVLELMPVAEFPGERGWGYDGVDLFAPHHSYGGPDGLKRLVDACHRLGVGVVLDVVYNHLGPDGNYLSEFGPYFSDRHHTAWGAGVNFDGPGSDEVRRFVIDNAKMWLRDYHCDGLRLDAVHAIIDQSAIHILEEMVTEIESLAAHLRRPIHLIAEDDRNDPRLLRSRHAGGYGLGAVWADEWHHAVHAMITGETEGYYQDFGDLETMAKALSRAWVHDGTWSRYRQRRHGGDPHGISGHQLVVCTQNHDQIGNRARGERSTHLVPEPRLRVAAALLLSSPFTPLIFQGEEWAASTPFQYFTDHHDGDLAAAVTAGRRQEFSAFGWDPDQIPDPQALRTFLDSKLDWGQLTTGDHRGMLDWYRQLIALRRQYPELSDPNLSAVEIQCDPGSGTVVVRRGDVWLLVNLGLETARFPLTRAVRLLAASQPGVVAEGDGVVIPWDAVAIVEHP